MSAGVDHDAEALPTTVPTRPPKVVVITGMARPLGAHLAARLARDPRIERIIGVDASPPDDDAMALLPGRLEFMLADLRLAPPVRLLINTGAEVVVHLAIASAADGHPGGRPG